MDVRNQVTFLSIQKVVFVGMHSGDFHQVASLYSQRETNTLYVVVSNEYQPAFNVKKWPPGFSRYEGWRSFKDIRPLKHLPQLAQGVSFDIDQLENDCKAEVENCVDIIEAYIDKVLRDIDHQARQDRAKKEQWDMEEETIRNLFSAEEKRKIIQFFDADMFENVQKLKTVMFMKHGPKGQEYLDFSNADDVSKFAELVRALKATPASTRVMSPDEASQHPAVEKIARAAAALEELRAQRKLNVDDNKKSLRNTFLARILGAILLAAPGALAGFKAGTAVGAMVGGGVASVPGAIIGGCVGALVGGSLGLFGGYKITPKIGEYYAQETHPARIIDKKIRNRIKSP